MWLSLVPFATNGTCGHGHGWKKNNVEDQEVISCKCSCSIVARMVKGGK
jgi:hypothetical protein